MNGKNQRHGSAFSVGVSIRPPAPQRTSGRGHRERSATNAISRLSAETETPAANDLGSGILDDSPQPVGRLATSPDLRAARYRRPLATRTVSEILGPAVQPAGPTSRSPEHRRRTPPIARANGCCKSVVARTQDSRRTQHARHRHLRTQLSRASCAGCAARRTRHGRLSCTTMSGKWSRPISLPCRPSR
jgi:hypothetical protein